MFSKIFKLIFKHKFITGIIIILIIVGGYFGYQKLTQDENTIRYITASVERGTLIVSISGSGQVSASQQIDIKPEVSGDLTYVNIKAGQKINKGQVLAYIDSKDAERTVRDTQISLESAQISLEKLVNNQQSNTETAVDDLSQSYRDAYNKVSDAFLSLPSFMELSRSILYDDSGISSVCSDNICAYSNLIDVDFRQEFKVIVDRAEKDYETAKNAYDPNFQNYRNIRLDASAEEIVTILKETKSTVELLAQAIKSEQNMLDSLVSDINESATKQGRKAQIDQEITNYQSNIGTTLSKLNSIISNLENADRSIESIKKSIENYQLVNPVDVRSQENTVLQKETALQDAKDNLENYIIKAPFSGIIAESDVEQGDSVSQNTILATLFTEQSIAQISLNELDIAKVKIDQKATITFDAVEDLTITGEVLEVDTLGTTNQGVVTYDVKIAFDAQDERVKPGMTLSVNIITEAKQEVFLVESSAIKQQGDMMYVQVVDNLVSAISASSLRMQQVQTGLSNDTMTEIIDGLREGDIIITQTTTTTATSPTPNKSNNNFMSGDGMMKMVR